MRCAQRQSRRAVAKGFVAEKIGSEGFCFKGRGSFSHGYKAKLDHDGLVA